MSYYCNIACSFVYCLFACIFSYATCEWPENLFLNKVLFCSVLIICICTHHVSCFHSKCLFVSCFLLFFFLFCVCVCVCVCVFVFFLFFFFVLFFLFVCFVCLFFFFFCFVLFFFLFCFVYLFIYLWHKTLCITFKVTGCVIITCFLCIYYIYYL